MRLIDANAAADAIVREVEKHVDDFDLKTSAVMFVFSKMLSDEEIFPTIEAEPVRHGRWLLLPNRTAPSKLFRCSECGNVTVHKHFSQNGYYAYCKDCGAKMDGGADNDID